MKNKRFDLIPYFFLISSIAIILLGLFIPTAKTSKALVMGIIIITLIVLDYNMAKIANLSKSNPKVKTMRTMNRLILVIFVLLGAYYIVSPSINISPEVSDKLIIIGMAIFIMIFGNICPKIPFNRYMGLRLPWTIRDEETWKVAHKVTGYLAFPIGIMMIIGCFFFKAPYIATVGVLSWVLIPGLYSLWFYYKKFKGLKN